MRALVVYESMFGNTHTVADRIGEGLASLYEVEVVPVAEADPDRIAAADLLVVGGPTHAHGISREASRTEAVSRAAEEERDLTLDPSAEGANLRDWFTTLTGRAHRAAAFDTRVDMSAVLTGRASKGIAKALRRAGFALVAEPESFLVDRSEHLIAGEEERARHWGASLANVA